MNKRRLREAEKKSNRGNSGSDYRARYSMDECYHCGGGGAHPGACRWCGASR